MNGCCLTVVSGATTGVTGRGAKTWIGRTSGSCARRSGQPRASTANGRYGGHVVGHVDAGEVQSIEELDDGSWRFTFTLPSELANYVVNEGIAVDGISLTVAAVTPSTFSIAIIPHTFAVTAIGRRNVGDTVNLEADVLAKYVERLVRPTP